MYLSYQKISILRLSKVILLSLFLSILFTGPYSDLFAGSKSAKLVKLETRPGVTLKFMVIKPAKPVASVILFKGGDGNIKLSSFLGRPSIGASKYSFLVRTRDEFAKNGFIVAVVDAPSDRQKGKGCSPSGKFGQWAVIPKLWNVYNAPIGGGIHEVQRKERA